MMVAAEHFAGDASWSGWQSAHVGIGTLPMLFFGNEQQKRKYLPKLANVEMLAAYALTEPHAGSDALAARTRADLSPDGTHYILNGQKMWITNGGAADLFTVFAKVGGEKFTAFLVERGFGVKSGAEEQKMGIKGSSTTALYFDNVPVPVENVLGEIGRGHIIAFNILNLGRLKLGPGTLGGAKKVLGTCLKYAKERKAFGSSIAEFGAIQHKLAEMAIRIYAAESITWRSIGLVESRLRGFSWDASQRSADHAQSRGRVRTECSIVKVYCFGNAGLRGGRRRSDPWRLWIPSGLCGGTRVSGFAHQSDFRRNQRNQPAADPGDAAEARRPRAAGAAGSRRIGARRFREPHAHSDDEEYRLVANAKKIALMCLAAARRKYRRRSGPAAGNPHAHRRHDHRGVCHGVGAASRAQAGREGRQSMAADAASVLLRDAMARVEIAARNVLAAAGDRAALLAFAPVGGVTSR